MTDPRPMTEARPPLIGGLRPDTCTCSEHPVPHWHCRWSGDGDWHCPQRPHIHLVPQREEAQSALF